MLLLVDWKYFAGACERLTANFSEMPFDVQHNVWMHTANWSQRIIEYSIWFAWEVQISVHVQEFKAVSLWIGFSKCWTWTMITLTVFMKICFLRLKNRTRLVKCSQQCWLMSSASRKKSHYNHGHSSIIGISALTAMRFIHFSVCRTTMGSIYWFSLIDSLTEPRHSWEYPLFIARRCRERKNYMIKYVWLLFGFFGQIIIIEKKKIIRHCCGIAISYIMCSPSSVRFLERWRLLCYIFVANNSRSDSRYGFFTQWTPDVAFGQRTTAEGRPATKRVCERATQRQNQIDVW